MSDNPPVAKIVGVPAGDDVSVAKSIAERYQEAGIDPARAYDDPETALQDFNLKDFGL